MTHSIQKTVFVSLLFVLISACATNIAGRKQISLVSESEAIEASKQAYVNTLKPYKDKGKLDSQQDVVARVNRITDKLIVQAIKKRPASGKWDWSIKVIDDPSLVNAWCMAGGKMAIYTGLITKLQATDDEIAQVMGHEISHALANHSAERMSMAMASELAVGAYSKVTGTVATKDSLPAMAAQVALTLPNSRTSESEADALGIELAAKAGYDPNAAVSLWQKMAKVSGSGGLEFLSTHPSPKNREKALRNLIPKMMPYYKAAR
jgi:predicted Zn-dependent protease